MKSFRLAAKISRELQDVVREEVKSKLNDYLWENKAEESEPIITAPKEPEDTPKPIDESQETEKGIKEPSEEREEPVKTEENQKHSAKKPKRRTKSYNLSQLIKDNAEDN